MCKAKGMDFSDDEDFKSPIDEIEYLKCQLNENLKEEPDLFCCERKAVLCKVNNHKFQVHFSCWEPFELKSISVVLKYCEDTQHLVLVAPFIGCAHCGENIVRFYDSRICETCVLFRHV